MVSNANGPLELTGSTSALCLFHTEVSYRNICHIYLDDIVIWSDSLEEHKKNVTLVLEALCTAHLYCSVKKSTLFSREIDFLGHHISECRIELDPKKIKRIINWPQPKSLMDV